MMLVLLSPAEFRVLRELAANVDHLGALSRERGVDMMSRPVIDAIREASASPALRRAVAQLDVAVRWDRAGRVYFGLTPACARNLVAALTRTRPMWDAGRGAQHVRWFLRRLTA